MSTQEFKSKGPFADNETLRLSLRVILALQVAEKISDFLKEDQAGVKPTIERHTRLCKLNKLHYENIDILLNDLKTHPNDHTDDWHNKLTQVRQLIENKYNHASKKQDQDINNKLVKEKKMPDGSIVNDEYLGDGKFKRTVKSTIKMTQGKNQEIVFTREMGSDEYMKMLIAERKRK